MLLCYNHTQELVDGGAACADFISLMPRHDAAAIIAAERCCAADSLFAARYEARLPCRCFTRQQRSERRK